MGWLKHRRWRRILIEVLVILALMGGIALYQGRTLVRGQAPPLSGRLLDGTPVNLAQFRGEPVMVHFWATWCPICATEQGTIDALAHDHRVLTVAMNSGDAAAIARYLKKKGVNYPVLPDPDGLHARTYGVRAVPATFILGPDGEVRFATVGYTTEWGMRLRLWWAGLH